MRIQLPDLKDKAMFDYLVKNKKELIRKKKLMPIKSQPLFSTSEMILPLKDGMDVKAAKGDESIDTGKLLVEVVGNAAWFCDYGMDVLVDTGYDKSIKEQGALIPHIKNHNHEADAHVGDVQEVYRKGVSLSRLGLAGKTGSAQCMCWKTIIRKDYDEKIYMMYKAGKINQHSICLQYLSIGLCINDKDYLPEFELWGKYYDKIINKEVVDEKSFFWIVPEFKVFENSCVLFGMNMLTPTLSAEEKELIDTIEPPAETMTQEPLKKKLNFKSLIINK